MIVVLIIALCMGLVIFFLGLSLLTIYKQNTDNAEENSLASDQYNGVSDTERESISIESLESRKEPKSYIFAIYLGAEGLILSGIAVMAIFIHQFAFKVRLFVSIPLLILYLVGCFVINALRMTRSE